MDTSNQFKPQDEGNRMEVNPSWQELYMQLPYPCKDCNKRYDSFSKREIHYRIHHLGQTFLEEKYKEEMSIPLYLCSNLERYFEVVQEHVHICPICDKGFSKNRYLKVHISKHTGVKEHQCQICQKRYADLYYLNKHLERHIDKQPTGDERKCTTNEQVDDVRKVATSTRKMRRLNSGGSDEQIGMCTPSKRMKIENVERSDMQSGVCIPNRRTESHNSEGSDEDGRRWTATVVKSQMKLTEDAPQAKKYRTTKVHGQ